MKNIPLGSIVIKLCPYCESMDRVRNGTSPRGIPRFKCKSCGRTYNYLAKPRGINKACRFYVKERYRSGESLIKISEYFNVSKQTLANWLKNPSEDDIYNIPGGSLDFNTTSITKIEEYATHIVQSTGVGMEDAIYLTVSCDVVNILNTMIQYDDGGEWIFENNHVSFDDVIILSGLGVVDLMLIHPDYIKFKIIRRRFIQVYKAIIS